MTRKRKRNESKIGHPVKVNEAATNETLRAIYPHVSTLEEFLHRRYSRAANLGVDNIDCPQYHLLLKHALVGYNTSHISFLDQDTDSIDENCGLTDQNDVVSLAIRCLFLRAEQGNPDNILALGYERVSLKFGGLRM